MTFLSKIIERDFTSFMSSPTHCEHSTRQAFCLQGDYLTEPALCSVVNNLLVLMDEGECSVLIMLSQSAVFDAIMHNLLFMT